MEWAEDAPAREKEAQLDGCYVVESDLPVAAATTQAVHDRYLDLTQVERDFRTLKTGLLEIRPVFLRRADRTRGHALVSLLALKLARALDRRVAPLGLTVDDAVERLKGVRLVCLGDAKLGLWRLADSYTAAQTEVLGVLPKLAAAPVNELRWFRLPRKPTPKWGKMSPIWPLRTCKMQSAAVQGARFQIFIPPLLVFGRATLVILGLLDPLANHTQ